MINFNTKGSVSFVSTISVSYRPSFCITIQLQFSTLFLIYAKECSNVDTLFASEDCKRGTNVAPFLLPLKVKTQPSFQSLLFSSIHVALFVNQILLLTDHIGMIILERYILQVSSYCICASKRNSL